jgi:small-conductance mechanosensitive channel
MRADNSRHLIDAAQRRSEHTRAKAILAIRTLDSAGDLVTFETVARQAGVYRSWLYAQPDLRTEVERLRAAHRRSPQSPVPARQRASDASLMRRLEAANDRTRQLSQENRQLREQLARALGEQRVAKIRTTARNPSPEHPRSVTISPAERTSP